MSGAAILAAKLALEDELRAPLFKVGMTYIRAIESARGSLGALPRYQFQEALEKVLIRHYARVTMVMQNRRPPRDASLEMAARSLVHLDRLRYRARRNAQMILASIDREISRQMPPEQSIDHGTENYSSLFKDFSDHEEKDDVLEARPVARQGATVSYMGHLKNAIGHVVRKFKAKLGTISNANTNAVAEEARSLEIVPPGQENGRLVKVWNSKMDGRERAWHHDAHLQEVFVDEVFDVGDQSLRFPGDTSLGATLDNIINCRCWLTYHFVKDDDGSRVPIYNSPSAPTRRYARPDQTQKPNIEPTSVVTLNGRTRANIYLADKKPAVMRQVTPSTLVITRSGEEIARATINGSQILNVRIAPGYEKLDLEGLMERSAAHSATMDRTPHAERLPR